MALNYFADQVMAKQGLDMVADLKIVHGHAFINGTVQLPNNPLGRYLNFKLKFDENEKIQKLIISGWASYGCRGNWRNV